VRPDSVAVMVIIGVQNLIDQNRNDSVSLITYLRSAGLELCDWATSHGDTRPSRPHFGHFTSKLLSATLVLPLPHHTSVGSSVGAAR